MVMNIAVHCRAYRPSAQILARLLELARSGMQPRRPTVFSTGYLGIWQGMSMVSAGGDVCDSRRGTAA
jgi:predicted metal-binding membrane protein